MRRSVLKDRKAYIDKMAAKLKEWDKEIQKLEMKADNAKANVKADYQEQIQALQNKIKEARNKLDEFKESGEDAWDVLKDGLEQSWKTLGDSIKKATSKFK